jgi:O-antigen/teichoic acid export membrane protein
MVFATAIPMARIIGPTNLGYFNYVQWLINIAGTIGSLGIPAGTRKYMAEYLGKGEPGVARAVFLYTIRLQVLLSATMVLGTLAVLFLVGDPAYRLVSAFQIVSIVPAMIGMIPAMANSAAENLKANVAGSLLSNLIYMVSVWLSLWLGWGLLGIGVGILLSRSLELFVRIVPVLRWVMSLPVCALSKDLRARLRSFSGQSTVLLLLNTVVWDRSDIVFLKMFSSNIAEITFFSLALNLSEKVLLAPRIFGAALGASVMAQFGRDKSKLSHIVSVAARYMLLCALPLLLGMSALSSSIVRLLYGQQYLPAIPVLALAAIFAIPKPMLQPPQQLLLANERQGFLMAWTCLAGIVNFTLDYLLIPKYGALGAAIGNGTAQLVAAIGVWSVVLYSYRLRLEVAALLKIVFAAAVMAAAVLPVAWRLPPWAALVVAVPTGAVIFLSLIRFTAAMKQEDRTRLLTVAAAAPRAARPLVRRVVDLIVPEAVAA